MPMGSDNIEDFSKKLREVRVKDLRARLKSGFTKPRIALLVILLLIIIFLVIIAPWPVSIPTRSGTTTWGSRTSSGKPS